MIKVAPLKDDTLPPFKKLFKDYFDELDCDDPQNLVDEEILPEVLKGKLFVDILSENKVSGFVIYEIEKDGRGNIREIFIEENKRGQGLGKFLLYTAEMKLRELGVKIAYSFPTYDAEKFFGHCGYARTSEYDDELDCFKFEKLNLNNHDCCK